MNKVTKSPGSKKGFTLIELSIVLVIIGLIVGGVLVGQDLIKAAELRATISQLEKYNAAVNTFRAKYDGYPGDLDSPTRFFSSITNADGGNGEADGDGLVEGISAAATLCTGEVCIAGEPSLFWYELSQANLIQESITANTDATDVTITPSDTLLPAAKTARGGRFTVSARSGVNYYVLGNPGTSESVSGGVAWTAGVTPIDAFQIDTKMDNGLASTGSVLSVSDTAPNPATAANGASSPSAGECYDSDDGTFATTSAAVSEVLGCNLSFKASF